MTELRSNFSDLFGTTALPMIHHIVFDKYKEKPDIIPQLFNYTRSDRDIEQTSSISGFSVATTIAENESVTYEDMIQGYDKTYTHIKVGKGFRVTKEMLDDGKFLTIQKKSMKLGMALYEAKQIEAASEFNDGFTAVATNPNGEALFVTTHALIRGGTEQNTLTTQADLSVTSLRQAITDIKDTRDDGNLRTNIVPKWLLVPDNGIWDATELLKSADRPDTANRAMNAFTITGIQPIAWSYLTDTDSWFLCTEPANHEMYFFQRQDALIESDKDFDTGAQKVKMEERYSHGWSDWRGLYGVQGA